MVVLMILEKIYPNCKLEAVPGWYGRALLFNSVQLISAIIGYYSLDKLFEGPSLFNPDLGPIAGGALKYIISTWIFYWWHRLRHESEFVWLILHQFHHSPTRLEIITAFYKHPLEIISNSIILTFCHIMIVFKFIYKFLINKPIGIINQK